MPPQVQLHFDELLSAGWLPISTVGDPGTHGAGVTGMQGIGVSTPDAAAVAEATVGFAKLLHMPNGGMLAIDVWSMIVAAVSELDDVRLVGSTLSADGVVPKEHVIRALAVTWSAIAPPRRLPCRDSVAPWRDGRDSRTIAAPRRDDDGGQSNRCSGLRAKMEAPCRRDRDRVRYRHNRTGARGRQ